jgi:hypothetical protein
MSSKRLFGLSFSVLVLIATLGFMGCGGGGGDDDGADPPAAPATPPIDVTGTWVGPVSLDGTIWNFTLTLVQTGSDITGTGLAEGSITRAYNGTISGNHVVLTSNPNSIVLDLTIAGNTMVGTYTYPGTTWEDEPANFTR